MRKLQKSKKKEFVELHELDPVLPIKSFPTSENAIGVEGGKLVVRIRPFSLHNSNVEIQTFDHFWIPPEMTIRRTIPFQTLVAFSPDGQVVGIYYIVQADRYGGTNILWMAGDSEVVRGRYQEPIPVTMSVTHLPPAEKSVLQLKVIVRGGKKFFALPDGWITDAIPAFDEFLNTTYLVGPASDDESKRWKQDWQGLTVRRRGKVVARGIFSTTGGMGSYTIVYLEKFTDPEDHYVRQLDAERFKEGDVVCIGFAWNGPFPIIQALLRHAQIENIIPTQEVGKTYAFNDFAKIARENLRESAQRVLPEMIKTKTIILGKDWVNDKKS